MSPDDIALLRAAFRAARAKHWSRGLPGQRDRAAGARYWVDDCDSQVSLSGDGYLETPISGTDCYSVEMAVDHLAGVGVLPVELHSAYRAGIAAGRTEVCDDLHELVKLTVAEWYDDLRAPCHRGAMKAHRDGYLLGVAEVTDEVCDRIGIAHPEWDHMREVVA